MYLKHLKRSFPLVSILHHVPKSPLFGIVALFSRFETCLGLSILRGLGLLGLTEVFIIDCLELSECGLLFAFGKGLLGKGVDRRWAFDSARSIKKFCVHMSNLMGT